MEYLKHCGFEFCTMQCFLCTTKPQLTTVFIIKLKVVVAELLKVKLT